MYTQCNHCKAIFRVTMKELTAAQGLLRCGECDSIFDAMKTLSTTLPEERRFAQMGNDAMTVDLSPSPIQNPLSEENEAASEKKGFFAKKSSNTTNASRNLLKPRPHKKPFNARTFLWIGISSLILLLLLQLLYSNRNWLAQQPLTANATKLACEALGCEIRLPRDVAHINLLSRNVYSHPNTPGVLTVSVSIQNDATFAQVYPLIEISFLNKENAIVALRRFTPDEYLKDYKGELMPAGTPIELLLNLSDPGVEAVRFQLRFI